MSVDTFRVDLEVFRGPMDLLLHLVKKHELDVTDLRLADITHQFLQHIEVLQELDIDSVGDFVDFASHLIEIKSRNVLPVDAEERAEVESERDELVRRLLEYKGYRDVASMLEEQSRRWQQRQSRRANDLPARRVDLGTQPLQEVELWDLVSAFGRILKENDTAKPASIVYDDTPIQVYMERIHEQIEANQRVAFSQMFVPGMHKSALIGIFLAMLELVRHHSVSTEQGMNHGEIWIARGSRFAQQWDDNSVDTYGEDQSKTPESGNLAGGNLAGGNLAGGNLAGDSPKSNGDRPSEVPEDSTAPTSNPQASNPQASNSETSGDEVSATEKEPTGDD
jgi:segregation and condensation protein A